MSSSITTELLGYLLERSVSFSVVFVVAGALWLLLRKRQSSHAGSLWFCLPLVVLVVPLERWIPNPWTSINPIERAASSVLPTSVDRVLVNPATEGFLDFSGWKAHEAETPETEAVAVEAIDEAWSNAALIDLLLATALGLWLSGLAIFVTRLVRGQRIVPRLLESATRLEQGALPLDLESLREDAGVQGPLTIIESPEFESPAVWTGSAPWSNASGRRAVLILPEGLAARMSADELRWVLLHELAHVARRDDLTELVQRVLGAAFFFHPLVWISNRLARVYRELACDDAALARCSAVDRPRCARALYEVVAHATALAGQPGAPNRTPSAMASLFHSKRLLRKRIMRLTELDRPLSRGLRAGAILPIVLTSAAALSAARFPALSVQDEVVEEELVVLDHDEVGPEVLNDPLSVAMRAVEWLCLDQDENGGWSYDPPSLDREGSGRSEDSAGAGWAADLRRNASTGSSAATFTPLHSDVALTGLALLALLEASEHDPTDVEVRAALDRGTAYLLSIQDADQGVYGPMDNPSFMVGHALATEALSKAWVGDLNAERTESLRAAVAFLERARNPYGAWRYSSPPDGDNDSRVTGYVLLALSAAYDAGVHASPESFASGMSYLAELEDAETGRTFYMQDRPFAFRLAGRHESFPAEHAEVPTAMHMRLRTIAGLAPAEPGTMRLAKNVLAANSPQWDPDNGTIDFNYWWQATEALASAKPLGNAWEQWSNDLRRALLDTQITQGRLWGTWPTVDAWSGPGLEVYTAATNAMSLFALVDAEQ